MKILACSFLVAVPFALYGCTTSSPKKPAKASWTEVKPVLQSRCLVCHTGEHPVIMPDFTSKSIVRQFIEPGNADASRLFQVLELTRTAPAAMPPTKHFLSRREREIIRAWIDEGAEWPDGRDGKLKPDPSMPSQVSS